MKKVIYVSVVAFVLGTIAMFNTLADEVEPASVQISCLRDEGSSTPVTNLTYYQGTTLSLTNSIMYTGSSVTSAVQNLDGCDISIVAGQPGVTNNVTAIGYSISTNDGTFGAEFTIPPYNPCYIEVTVSNTSIYTYPRYRITTQATLPE